MRSVWIWGLAVVGALFLTSRTVTAGEPVTGPGSESGLGQIRELGDQAGLPPDVITFLQVIAYRESRGFVDVGLGPNDHPGRPTWLRPSKAPKSSQKNEARASTAEFRRLSKKNTYAFPEHAKYGSGGWFGMLAAYVPHQLGYHVDPWIGTTPPGSLASGVSFMRGLMGYSGFKKRPTFDTLYAGWGGPPRMSSPAAINKRRKSFAKYLDKLGIPRSFMDRKVPSKSQWPKGRAVLATLGGGDVA